MKAMVLNSTAPVESAPLVMTDISVPEPGPSEVLIRVNACGLCHTDLHIVEGELPPHRMPLVPGHQIVGVVEKAGAGAARKVGEKVGVPWLNRACGKCEYCISGRENLCERGLFTGYDIDGGLAEFTMQHGEWVYGVPEGYPDVQAAPLLCAGIIGWRALKLSEAKAGKVLGLFGFGASAHVTIQIARHLGIEVFAFTRGEHHKKLAMDLGASWAGAIDDKPPSLIDSGIIFAPAGEIVPPAMALLKKGGTMAMAGIYMTPIPQLDYNKLLYHERKLLSVANSTRDDCRELLDLAARAGVRTEVEEFNLADVNRALILLKQSKLKAAAVVRMD